MLPGQSVCGSVQPHLPIPRLVHQPMDPIFTRSRQFLHDFPPSLVSQILTYNSNILSCKDTNLVQPRSCLNDKLSPGEQNLPQELPHKSNPYSFIPLNQEVNTLPSKPVELLPEQVKINGCMMSMGASTTNNCQTNGPSANTRFIGDGLSPAIDPNSFYNRLYELFPDIHPPQLHRVFDECGRDFLRTIDNILYARRLRKSIMTQMVKLRSQQRNQPSSCVPNPQQQKDQEACNRPQPQAPQQQKPEKQPRQSPKSQANSKNTPNVRAKKNRILAFQPSPNPSRRSGISLPKSNQTTQSPGSSMHQSMRKPSSPPPNVYVHQIDMGHQVAGSGDGTPSRKVNQSYIFSFRRPPANTYGTLPQPNMNVPISTCGDYNSFRPQLPPPPPVTFFSPPQLPLSDWCHKDMMHFEPHVSIDTPQEQREQNTLQDINNERVNMNQQSSDQDHLRGEASLSAPQQNNNAEAPEWTLLLKTIMDPMQSVDSSSNSGMINMQPMEGDEVYDAINQKKQGNGNFFFKVSGNPGFSFVPDTLRKHTEEDCNAAQIGDTGDTHQGIKLSNDSVHNSLSDEADVADLNRKEKAGMDSCNTDEQMDLSPSRIINGSRKSLGESSA